MTKLIEAKSNLEVLTAKLAVLEDVSILDVTAAHYEKVFEARYKMRKACEELERQVNILECLELDVDSLISCEFSEEVSGLDVSETATLIAKRIDTLDESDVMSLVIKASKIHHIGAAKMHARVSNAYGAMTGKLG